METVEIVVVNCVLQDKGLNFW